LFFNALKSVQYCNQETFLKQVLHTGIQQARICPEAQVLVKVYWSDKSISSKKKRKKE
jgi:hypothetical protein